jgi:hypothetical protein
MDALKTISSSTAIEWLFCVPGEAKVQDLKVNKLGFCPSNGL